MSPQQAKDPQVDIELEDIQGNILRPYGMNFARYLYLTFSRKHPDRAREWLRNLSDQLTTAAPWTAGKPRYTLNLGLSHEGLDALDLPPSVLETFPAEFQMGMTRRAQILGDVGPNGHEHWDEAFQDPKKLHAVLMIHAQSKEACEEGQRKALSLGGAEAVEGQGRPQDAQRIPGPNGTSLEHFGFVDGIGQPAIEGAPPGAQHPGQGTWDSEQKSWAPLALGSFVLGYPDSHGQLSIFPNDEQVRKNGTYLVLRKLQQDVLRFRQYLRESAPKLGWSEEKLAARLIGRWKNGTPLALSPDDAAPGIAGDPARNNDFLFGGDPDGARCPVGAHVRRVNPRDSAFVRNVKAHRIIRRSMPYGPLLAEGVEADGEQRGMVFLAFNTSLGQQFEMIQQQWLNSGNGSQGLSSMKDPLSPGGRPSSGLICPVQTPLFTVPSDEVVPGAGGDVKFASNTLPGLPSFVEVKGGEYFFVPGIKALKHLAQRGVTSQLRTLGAQFLQAYLRCDRILDPSLRSAAQKKLLMENIFSPPGMKQDPELWEVLRKERPILVTPLGVLVAKYKDTVEVLGRGDVFSVRGYDARMQNTTGAFFLGFDDSGRYEIESSIARQVMRRDDLPRIRELTTRVTVELIAQVAQSGENLNVSNLAVLALLRVIGNYFGVSGPNDKTMLNWFKNISAHIFLPIPPPVAPDGSKDPWQLGSELQVYLDRVIAARKVRIHEQLKRKEPGPDDVLQRLFQLRDAEGRPLDECLIRRELAGLISGSLIATAGVLADAFKYFISKLTGPLKARLMQAVEMGNDKVIGAFVLEAARFDPTPAVLYRFTRQDYTLNGTPIPEDTLVVCSLGSAMRDEESIPYPELFWLNRPDWAYLNFGFGQHACLGRYLGMTLMTGIVQKLLSLNVGGIVQNQSGYPGLPIDAHPGMSRPEDLVISVEHPKPPKG